MEKKTPAQVFSYEFCEILKNTYCEEHPRTPTSVKSNFNYRTANSHPLLQRSLTTKNDRLSHRGLIFLFFINRSFDNYFSNVTPFSNDS